MGAPLPHYHSGEASPKRYEKRYEDPFLSQPQDQRDLDLRLLAQRGAELQPMWVGLWKLTCP